jgi:hypothetical protein
MKSLPSLPRLYMLVALLFVCAFAAAGTLPGSANSVNSTNSTTHQLIVLTPTNLRQPANAADCQSHVYVKSDNIYYGCSHPSANYIFLVWDYSGKADGFHVYRTDVGRQDYGIRHYGTLAQIYYAGGRACWVVTAVRGTSESPDSNQFCLYAVPARMHAIPH